jgi:hypothetical protein
MVVQHQGGRGFYTIVTVISLAGAAVNGWLLRTQGPSASIRMRSRYKTGLYGSLALASLWIVRILTLH